jgi:tRNA pseudouridine55 synthase
LARRKKGNPVHGWLILDKPSGIGSTPLVGKAKWALQAQKCGHAGTLDPLATGVLALALGEATKTVQYVMDGDKSYRFTVRWGVATNTDDAEGEPTETSGLRPTRAEIEAAIPPFIGMIQQIPPAYSAIKINGQRSYALARKGEAVALAARPIRMDDLRLIDQPDADTAVFEMTCGKGGYVRAIGRDLGQSLGCFGHITQLRRTQTGPFTLEDAISLENLEQMRDMPVSGARLISVATGLDGVPALAVTEAQATQLRNGQAVPVAVSGLDYGTTAWASLHGTPVAIGSVKGGLLHPERVLLLDDAEGN